MLPALRDARWKYVLVWIMDTGWNIVYRNNSRAHVRILGGKIVSPKTMVFISRASYSLCSPPLGGERGEKKLNISVISRCLPPSRLPAAPPVRTPDALSNQCRLVLSGLAAQKTPNGVLVELPRYGAASVSMACLPGVTTPGLANKQQAARSCPVPMGLLMLCSINAVLSILTCSS
ncbi:hypothetical protein Tco_1191894 [Tanacetum coccineum]